MRYLKIQLLKFRMRRTYCAIQNLHARYDCGQHMTDILSGGRLNSLVVEFNGYLDKLAVLDPDNCPAHRMEVVP